MVNIIFCISCGIFFCGVDLLESICSGSKIRIISSFSCGIEWVRVFIKMLIEVVVNRLSVIFSINRGIDFLMGICKIFCIISISDNLEIISIIRFIDQILVSIILNGVIGIISRCLMVLCFCLWISVELVRIMVSMVILLMIVIIVLKCFCLRLGLKCILIVSFIGSMLLF